MTRMLSSSRDWLRLLLIWLASAFLLGLLAGEKRFDWSDNDHFAHLARDLHAGRWTHPTEPPGFCSKQARATKACRYHRFDDWAHAQELVLDPKLARNLGTKAKVWAKPCRTSPCRKNKQFAKHRWWIPSVGLITLPQDQYRLGSSTWFVSFPVGPTLWFLIPLWLGLPMLPDIPLTWILAGTIPATLDVAVRGRWPDLGRNWALTLALASLFASAMVSVAVQGQVWFLAQLSFAALLSGGLACWYRGGAWGSWAASLCWGFALGCRPSTVFGLLPAIYLFARKSAPAGEKLHSQATGLRSLSRHRVQLRAFLGPVLAMVTMAAWNWHRFGSFFEFGHHFLEIRWLQRIQSQGMFDSSYLWKNLLSFTCLTPKSITPFHLSIHGIGWFWSTPWICWLSCQRRKDWSLLTCVALGIAPALLYQNTGQLQVSYRFALDLLPLWVMAVAPGCTTKSRSFVGIVVYALVLNLGLAWAWVHRPTLIFGTSPTNWPFL